MALCLGVLIPVLLGFWPAGVPTIESIAGAVIIVLVLFFSFLTVEIDEEEVRCSFWPGWVRKRFALSEIAGAAKVQNPWYYGYGIRRTPHGWMYNVSGPHAVELSFKSGKRFRIGTNEPDQLLSAIRSATGLWSSSR